MSSCNGLLCVMGKCFSLYQGWLPAVSDRFSRYRHADSVCRVPLYDCRHYGYFVWIDPTGTFSESGEGRSSENRKNLYFFFYVGLAHTTGVKGSIVEASNVFLAILVSSLIFHQEKLDQKKVLGCIVGFAGVVLINLSGSNVDMSFNLTGDGFIFISAIAYALSSVLIKKYSAKSDPVMLRGYQFTAGGLVMILIGFVMGGRIHTASMPAMILLIYMALISAVAYTLWGILLKYNPVSKVSIFGFTNPVFGVILSAIILREGNVFGMKDLIALVLVSIGILIVNWAKPGTGKEKGTN